MTTITSRVSKSIKFKHISRHPISARIWIMYKTVVAVQESYWSSFVALEGNR